MAKSSQYGAFVPTNLIWDVQNLYTVDVQSPEFKELLVRMYQNINNIALVLNIKDTGMYQLSEFVNGQLLFPNPQNNSSTPAYPANRQILRQVYNFGALPATATKSVPHNIVCNATTTFTRIYGAASDTTGFNYIQLPYASNTAGASIQLNLDGTNINVTTGSDRSNFNITYIVVEYVQS
jgi:hypothetical protein